MTIFDSMSTLLNEYPAISNKYPGEHSQIALALFQLRHGYFYSGAPMKRPSSIANFKNLDRNMGSFGTCT